MNGAQQLAKHGQSVWLDDLNRKLLDDGGLSRHISEHAVTGLTSNPAILQKAIGNGTDYDDALRAHLQSCCDDPEHLVFAVATHDIRKAADLLSEVHKQSDGRDGFVSLEVSPTLTQDAPGTIAAGQTLFEAVGRRNVLIKVPGTTAGLDAAEQLVFAGIPVNVTLLFTPAHYQATSEAYLRAIERRLEAGLDLDVPSVASVFVSRWDSLADADLPPDLHATVGVAMASLAYREYRGVIDGERWQALAAAGARPQRALWASTSNKSPGLPSTYYVSRLVAEGTVNTMPQATLDSWAATGTVEHFLEPADDAPDILLKRVSAEGFEVANAGDELQAQGIQGFSNSWSDLLSTTADKAARIWAQRKDI